MDTRYSYNTDELFNYYINSTDYDISLDNIKVGNYFPSNNVSRRQSIYRYYERLYDGSYAYNRRLTYLDAMLGEMELPYKVTPLNYFQLVVDKIVSLMFGNEVMITTGDIDRDKAVKSLAERVNWSESMSKAVKMACILGDSCIKTYKDGVSVFKPYNCYKVLNQSNIDDVLCYVLYEFLYNKDDKGEKKPSFIRIELHFKGIIKEYVFNWTGSAYRGTIGEPVDYKYNNRIIKSTGNDYSVEDDITLIQWMSTNKNIDGVYGNPAFKSIIKIVEQLELRLSAEGSVVDNHIKPILVVGQNNIYQNEKTGEITLKQLNGKYIINNGDGPGLEYLTWDGKLDASKSIREDLMSYMYELSELGRTFLSGEYSGNISEETFTNTIKSAIDKAIRIYNEVWSTMRQSLYVLCRLNGIKIDLYELNIINNIGRTDDDFKVAEIIEKLNTAGIFSKATLLEKYFGYTKEQANEELRLRNEEYNIIQGGNNTYEENMVRET